MPQNFPTNRQNPNRKDESIRRANRVIQTRTFVLMLIMGIGMFRSEEHTSELQSR